MNYTRTRICFMMLFCYHVSQPYDDGYIQFDVIYSYMNTEIICTKTWQWWKWWAEWNTIKCAIILEWGKTIQHSSFDLCGRYIYIVEK